MSDRKQISVKAITESIIPLKWKVYLHYQRLLIETSELTFFYLTHFDRLAENILQLHNEIDEARFLHDVYNFTNELFEKYTTEYRSMDDVITAIRGRFNVFRELFSELESSKAEILILQVNERVGEIESIIKPRGGHVELIELGLIGEEDIGNLYDVYHFIPQLIEFVVNLENLRISFRGHFLRNIDSMEDALPRFKIDPELIKRVRYWVLTNLNSLPRHSVLVLGYTNIGSEINDKFARLVQGMTDDIF